MSAKFPSSRMALASLLVAAGMMFGCKIGHVEPIHYSKTVSATNRGMLIRMARDKGDLRNAAIYHKVSVVDGVRHTNSGEYALCGEVGLQRFFGVAWDYRPMIVTLWISDGSPLPDPEHESNTLEVDDATAPDLHEKFQKDQLEACQDGDLPPMQTKKRQLVSSTR